MTLFGAPALIIIVAACYFVAAGFCWTLPSNPPTEVRDAGAAGHGVAHDAEQALGSTLSELREGITFIRSHRSISWSLTYLAIAASLIGVLGVLGPGFATDSLGLLPKDFVVIVLPLGLRHHDRDPAAQLVRPPGAAAPHHRGRPRGARHPDRAARDRAPIARFLQRAETATGLGSLADFTSLLAIVVLIALLAGMAYACVAIPSQTQLQEDLPEDVRGRVFGILNMLVSVASFAPILIVGPLSDQVGTVSVLIAVGVIVSVCGLLSIIRRGPMQAREPVIDGSVDMAGAPMDPVAVATAAATATATANEVGSAAWAGGRSPPTTRTPGTRGRGMTPYADLVVVGRIATLAGAEGAGWAEAIAVRGGRVVAAGRADDVAGLAGPGTRRLDLRPDEVAIPGLTDAHLHLADAALERSRVDLAGCESIDELVGRVREAALENEAGTAGDRDTWIEGGGWDPDALGRWPTANDLDRAAPRRLVALWAHDHHALVASSAALVAAGIDERRADPAGGVIRRDEGGRPTGVLHERASSLVTQRVPRPTSRSIADALVPLATDLLALGVVAVHDPGSMVPPDGLGGPLEAYRTLAAAGSLPLRVHASLRADQLAAAGRAGLRSGAPLGPDPLDRLRLGWLKTFADGSLGSRTAALLRPMEPVAGETPPNDGLGRVARGTGAAARAGRVGRGPWDRDADPRDRRCRGPGCARRAGADRR